MTIMMMLLMMMMLMLTSYESVLVWRKRKKVVDKDNRATNSLHLRRNYSEIGKLFLQLQFWVGSCTIIICIIGANTNWQQFRSNQSIFLVKTILLMKFHLPKVQCQKNQHGTSLLASLQTQSETFTLPVEQILFEVDATFIQLSLILSFLNHRISMISSKR